MADNPNLENIGAANAPPSSNLADIIEIFLNADLVVKAIILLLLLGSFASWAVIIHKAISLNRSEKRGQKFLQELRGEKSLLGLYRRISDIPSSPFSLLFVAAVKEWENNSGELFNKRLAVLLDNRIEQHNQKFESGLNYLASLGASAPFIGLFGTVWGIMNSFRAIAESEQNHLAIVAPGISEALFATAMGLFASIPAVIAYNLFLARIKKLLAKLEAFANEIEIGFSKK